MTNRIHLLSYTKIALHAISLRFVEVIAAFRGAGRVFFDGWRHVGRGTGDARGDDSGGRGHIFLTHGAVSVNLCATAAAGRGGIHAVPRVGRTGSHAARLKANEDIRSCTYL